MASDPSAGANFRFLPLVRRGFRPETPFQRDRSSTPIPGPIQVGVELTLAARSKDGGTWDQEPEPIDEGDLERPGQDVRMYGPGDVVGIDETHVSRLEPEPDSNSFPANLFPLVEFSRADLPWLFSPERADLSSGKSRNRPWLTLVVVPTDAKGVSVDSGGTKPLPVLTAPTSELPPLSQSWAWAHAQVVGDDTAAGEVVRNSPERAVSRLVCPRNLDENRKYVAAVVPTFEPGRRAGLGRSPYRDTPGSGSADGDGGDGTSDGDGTTPIAFSWTDDTEDPVELPIYLHWEFTSGAGDFEALASRLSPVRLSEAEVGRREVDVRDPGPDRIGHHEATYQTGALKAPSIGAPPFPNRTELVRLLNQPYSLARQQQANPGEALPVVGAPLYGQWHADETHIDPTDTGWFTQLNATLQYRIAAGLGAEAIRENQEDYAARAWDQVGELDAVNRKLAGGQLARAASTHIHDRLVNSVGLAGEKNPARLLQFTQPLHRTVGTTGSDATVDALRSFKSEFEDMVDFPSTVLSPTFRRLSRPTGPLLRNANVSVRDGSLTASSMAADFEAKTVQPADLKSGLRQRVGTLDDLVGVEASPGLGDGVIDDGQYAGVGPGPGGDDPWTEVGGWGGGDGEGGGLGGGAGGGIGPVVDGTRSTQPGVAQGGTQWQAMSGTMEGSVSTESPATAPDDGIALPGESRHVPAQFPTGVDVVTPELARVARLGSWAGDLPEVDLRRIDLSNVTPATPRAFAVRKVDVQVGSSIDHAATAMVAIRSLSVRLDPTDERTSAPAPTTVAAHADAVETNTFDALVRSFDNLRSTAPDATPTQVSDDRVAFVEGLRADHRSAVDALAEVVTALEERGLDPARSDLGSGTVDPATPEAGPDSVEVGDLVTRVDHAAREMQAVLDRLQRLRTSLRVGPEMLQTPAGREGAVQFGRTYDRTQPEQILDHVDPDITITETVLSGVTAAGELADELSKRPDPIEPVRWAPEFPDPMADVLESLSQEYLMPGVADIPRDSVGALATDPAFVEAFLAGANHEFARELLWRRFPTDRKGTYFDTFWDKAHNPLSTADDRPDIADMHTWRDELGGNQHESGRQGTRAGDWKEDADEPEGRVVLVIRGELLRRFPDTSVYMVESYPDEASDADEANDDRAGRSPKLSEVGHVTPEAVQNGEVTGVKFPIFQGKLDPDIRFLGFDLSPSDAVGDPEVDDPGWFFVFEEPMGETRFGLDAGEAGDRGTVPNGVTAPGAPNSDGTPLDTGALTGEGGSTPWNGLSWNHLVGDDAGPGDIDELVTYVDLWDGPPGAGGNESNTWRVTDGQVSNWTTNHPDLVEQYPELANARAEWGRNSAHMARITWQRPVRVAIHADDLLSAEVADQ
ncbi:hypothetical protein [Haloarchaeobius litoreus]|uniref:Uncharacterized protein n=1 Tax=Haloarchaeobius litoreus TaxID=755306 RepID=A0ABD6DGP3_9EURY|nr:hypothetical protein [Haloarchaeobius litoreus]